jgi:uncharacterized protein (TIGR02466 family)
MTKQYTIQGLFPTPVMFGEMGRAYTKEELAFVKESYKKIKKNAGNIHTTDTYILNQPAMAGIKSILDEYIKEYYTNIMCVNMNKVSPYITQSWINYTKSGEHHHRHAHPNSLVSGVLYIDSDKEKDKILLYNPQDNYRRIKPETISWNAYNSESWWFPVGTGELIMFPSELEHMVVQKEGKNLRTSLAFNTFLKGDLGITLELTELKL